MSALAWRSLSVRYGERLALGAGPLDLASGQLVALLGPNGSGKSSLLKALAGAVPCEATGLRMAGRDAGTLSRSERARILAYLSQTRTGPALATVREVLELGRFPHGGQDPDGRVGAVLDTLDLEKFAERRFGTLSGGEQARVLLARALCVDAPVLLADEPTAALDPYYALAILDALKTEAERGRLVLVSLHDLALAERYADRAVVLDGGTVAADGPVNAALSDAVLDSVFRVGRSPRGLTRL